MEENIKKLIEYIKIWEKDPVACHSYGNVYRCKCCKNGMNIPPFKHKKDCWIINFLAKYDNYYKKELENSN